MHTIRALDDSRAELIHNVRVDDMAKHEAALLSRYQDKGLGHEWFSLSDQDVWDVITYMEQVRDVYATSDMEAKRLAVEGIRDAISPA